MIQIGYKEDMATYAKQVRRYEMGVRLRGINDIEDTNMQNVHFSYEGEVWSVIVHRDTETIEDAVEAKIKLIKEMYSEQSNDTEEEA